MRRCRPFKIVVPSAFSACFVQRRYIAPMYYQYRREYSYHLDSDVNIKRLLYFGPGWCLRELTGQRENCYLPSCFKGGRVSGRVFHIPVVTLLR